MNQLRKMPYRGRYRPNTLVLTEYYQRNSLLQHRIDPNITYSQWLAELYPALVTTGIQQDNILYSKGILLGSIPFRCG